VSKNSENTVLQKTISRILGCALLLYGSTALAFTLITLPPGTVFSEQTSPSDSITSSTTLQTQVTPIAGTIRSQIFSLRRPRGADRTSSLGIVLAANSYSGFRSDVDYLAAAPGDSSGGGNGGKTGGNNESLWVSGMSYSLENEFSRTAFHGTTQNMLFGFDMTRSEKFVAGLSVGYETSNFVTTFNTGNERTTGFNVNPYFAYLLSDTWSVDLILGYGQFNTRQSRTIGTAVPLVIAAVDSEFKSTRGFASANLTNISMVGDWKLTGSLGALGSRREQDAYVETDGTAIASSKLTAEQYSLLAEAAYGRGKSETFFGAMYQYSTDPVKVQFVTGQQPPDDPDSVLLSAGWRYFGKDLTANFVFSGRVGQEQVKEYGFSMVLRVDL
jgi:hypothetical protein